MIGFLLILSVLQTTILSNEKSFTLDENSPVDTLVGSLDSGSYNLIKNDFFKIAENNEIRVYGPLDRDDNHKLCTEPGYPKLCIWRTMAVSTDGKNYLPVRITVKDVNDNSPSWSLTRIVLNISESVPINHLFELPSANDPDYGVNSVRSYEIIEKTSYFSIDHEKNSEPKLRVTQRLDHETIPRHEFTIKAMDGTYPYHNGTLKVVININDENDHTPTFISSHYSAIVHEDSPPGSVVQVRPIIQDKKKVTYSYTGKLKAFDKDSNENGKIEYKFAVSTPSQIWKTFSLDPENGLLKVISELNYDKGPRNWTFNIIARDHGQVQLSGTTTLSITLINSNNHPPEMHLKVKQSSPRDENSLVVYENRKPNNKSLSTLTVTEKDDGQAGEFQCRLDEMSDEVKAFDLRLTGKLERIAVYNIFQVKSFDREVFSQYFLKLLCIDNGSPKLSSEIEVNVEIIDENDNVPVFNKNHYFFSINEESDVETSIGSVNATDLDIGSNGKIDYEIEPIKVNERIPIKIDSHGNLYAVNKLDRERNPNGFEFLVIARDNGPTSLSSSATVSVNLIDINDKPPIFDKQGYYFEVEENFNNLNGEPRKIGYVKAYDEDENSEVEYRIIGSKSKFEVNSDGLLSAIGLLDREIRESHILTVLAIDSEKNSIRHTVATTVQIKVLDVNDNAPLFRMPKPNEKITISFRENKGIVVTKVDVIDFDEGKNAEINLSIDSPKKGFNLFTINENSKDLILARDLTKHNLGLHKITLTARDNAKNSKSSNLDLIIEIDESEPKLKHLNSFNKELNDGIDQPNISNVPIKSSDDLLSFNNLITLFIMIASVVIILFCIAGLLVLGKRYLHKKRLKTKRQKIDEINLNEQLSLQQRNAPNATLHDLLSNISSPNNNHQTITPNSTMISIPKASYIYPIRVNSPGSSTSFNADSNYESSNQTLIMSNGEQNNFNYLTANYFDSDQHVPLNIQIMHDLT